MNHKDERGTPLDYSESNLEVYFEVADKKRAFEVLIELGFPGEIKEEDNGFTIRICIQQIPEVVRAFANANIALYEVAQDRSSYKESTE